MKAQSIDSIVTDPPYGLSFMGKEWDHGVPGIPFWQAALRVAKPGVFLLAFGGTRTFHRLAVAIEDAGWEIRDTVMWVYGSGFPKSLDVSKAIDKNMGKERKTIGKRKHPTLKDTLKIEEQASATHGSNKWAREWDVDAPASNEAKQWEGFGTALKPAWEPIIVARKPLIGTVAENVLKYGTGAMNIDGCRVGVDPDADDMLRKVSRKPRKSQTWEQGSGFKNETNQRTGVPGKGRWPANLIHDGSEEVLELFPNVKAGVAVGRNASKGQIYGGGKGLISQEKGIEHLGYFDSGSAARFFYCAKASKADREEGCEGLPQIIRKRTQSGGDDTRGRPTPINRNPHPTVKPTALMRYLCKLVTPPNGTILDPFMGSGSTGKAAIQEGLKFIGIEIESEYVEIAKQRIR